jgi:hypothetical protein
MMGFASIVTASGELIFGLAAGAKEEKQPDDVCDANASLIAAAPELFSALQALLACPELADCDPADKELETEIAERAARAALAKAGEKQ